MATTLRRARPQPGPANHLPATTPVLIRAAVRPLSSGLANSSSRRAASLGGVISATWLLALWKASQVLAHVGPIGPVFFATGYLDLTHTSRLTFVVSALPAPAYGSGS